MKSGADLIKAERHRQVRKERWTTAHDDKYTNCELPLAAICYAANDPQLTQHGRRVLLEQRSPRTAVLRDPWPWADEWDKRHKHDRIHQLAIAGALIAAEIDRLQRKSSKARAS